LTPVRGVPLHLRAAILERNGWEDAPDVRDRVIVNFGDLMARWMNDRSFSMMHRAVNPETGDWKRSRYSIVFFYPLNYDRLIECIETCQSE